MKKTNLLRSFGAKLALAVVAFGAVLTSCTKEEFTVDVKPNNAKIFFSPSVVNPIANATVDARFSGIETITGNPSIAAGSRVIEATTADGATGSTTVAYAAVEAGTTVTYSPIIYLDNGLFTLKQVGDVVRTSTTKAGNVTNGHTHKDSDWYINKSDYSAKFTASWNETAETEVKVNNIAENTTQLQAYLGTLSTTKTVTGEETYELAAWEMFGTIFTITSEAITYNVVSIENSEFVVANITITNPLAEISVKENRAAIPGNEDHYHAGHSHGPSDNAGGGIGWAN